MKQKSVLEELFSKKRGKPTPEEEQKREEERKRKEEELQRQENERIQREGEVKALFDDIGKHYGKTIYKARVPKLIEYLKSDNHALAFWADPHIKKIYNISNEVSFILSIYAEETDDTAYEKWLRRYFVNPFNNEYVENYSRAILHQSYAYYADLVMRFGTAIDCLSYLDLSHSFNESKNRLMQEDNDELKDDLNMLERNRFIKARTYRRLLDKNSYYRTLVQSEDDEIYFMNPLFVMDNNFLRLDAYDVWRKSLRDEWIKIENNTPTMMKLLDELVRTRRIYVKAMEKKQQKK